MKRLLALLTIFALTAAPLATRVEAQGQAATNRGISVPVAGAAAGGAGTFTGTLRITRFVNSGGQMMAQGILTGIGTVAGQSQSIIRTVSVPVDLAQSVATAAPAAAAAPAPAAIGAQAVCDILHLVLGPLHLDLLGLVIDLNQVVLDITAEQGPGNLLGNLLCAITGLLDGGSTNQLAQLLNQLLGILGGLGL